MRHRIQFGGPTSNQVQNLQTVAGMVLGIVIPSVVGGLILKYHRLNLETALIRDLADRGMSADDIARIVSVSMPPATAGSRKQVLSALPEATR